MRTGRFISRLALAAFLVCVVQQAIAVPIVRSSAPIEQRLTKYGSAYEAREMIRISQKAPREAHEISVLRMTEPVYAGVPFPIHGFQLPPPLA